MRIRRVLPHALVSALLFVLLPFSALAGIEVVPVAPTPLSIGARASFVAMGDVASYRGEVNPAGATILASWLESHHGRPVSLSLAGPGGDAGAAAWIIHAVLSHGNVHTSVLPGDGCASACSMIWAAGESPELPPGAALVLHGASCDGPDCATHGAQATAIVDRLQRLLMERAAPDILSKADEAGAWGLHGQSGALVEKKGRWNAFRVRARRRTSRGPPSLGGRRNGRRLAERSDALNGGGADGGGETSAADAEAARRRPPFEKFHAETPTAGRRSDILNSGRRAPASTRATAREHAMTTLHRIFFAFLAAASVAAAVPTDAFARDNGFAEGVVAGAILGGALAQPGPAYGYPPPVVYQAPPPYYQAPPVYVPAPVYAPVPGYYPPPSVIYVPEPGYGYHHRHYGW